jgi:cell division protein FtsQ
VIGVALFVAVRRIQAYVATNPQFGLSRHGVIVDGLRYASRARVLRLFEADFGRSIYLTPLAERRRRLLAVDWVEDAIVSRVWPDRIWVRIRERIPVAFVNVPLGRRAGSKIALIDGHGVILEQPARARFTFPVLTGVSGEQLEAQRRRHVSAMLDLLEDLGPSSRQVSEVNTAQLDNLVVMAEVDGSTVELMLGDTNFGKRFRSFVEHYEEIRKRSPLAKAFDLRLEDRITAKE